MAKPQQPDSGVLGDPGDIGRIPEDQLPGHHPTVEQDKPSGEAFLEKLHEHASGSEAAEDSESDDADADDEATSDLADRAAEAVGKPFEAAADLLQKVRDRLDG